MAPYTLTSERKQRILAYLRVGNAPLTAARACGVSESTWYRWLKQGREGKDAACVDLLREVEEAMAQCQAHLVALVRNAAPKDWRAAMALLERRWREEWGRAADPSPALPAAMPQLSREERLRLARISRHADPELWEEVTREPLAPAPVVLWRAPDADEPPAR